MNKQIVEFVAHREITNRIVREGVFEFRKDRPAHWLQKLCFFVLRKLGAFRIDDVISVERHIIDSDEFMGRLFEQNVNIQKFFNMRPERVLIGSEDYSKLMEQEIARHQFGFSARYAISHNIFGLKVEVIPWMRGILVMPEEKMQQPIEKRETFR